MRRCPPFSTSCNRADSERDDAEAALKDREQRFLQALQDYQDNVKSKYKVKMDLSLASVHHWTDVLQAIESLRAVRDQRKSFWAAVQRKLHWFGEHSSVFQQWSGLLPTQSNYFSVLCGGLKLIFMAAERLKKIRDWICDALIELPTLLSCTDKTLDVFDDAELHICSRQLMALTFESLHWIVKELTRSAMKKGPIALLQQDSYAQDLRTSLDDVKRTSERFKRIADACAHVKLGNIDKATDGLREEAMLASTQTTATIVNTSKVLDTKLNLILALLQTGFSDALDKRLPLVEKLPQPPKVVSRADEERKRARTRNSILKLLVFDIDVIRADLHQGLDSIWTASRAEHDRVHYIVSEPQLAAWVSSHVSGVLLVEGCGSYVPAKLANSVSAANVSDPNGRFRSVCLYHLCGEHLREVNDDLAGPSGMLRSFV